MFQNENVAVSVIMASYNSSLYIAEAIESILNQTFKAFELIIIDDCSSDNSLEIAKAYKERDGRIVIIALEKRSGPAIARNAGIAVAKGEWIAILDSDDIAMPTRLEEQMQLTTHANVVMISSDLMIIDAQGRKIQHCKYPTSHWRLSHRLYSKKAFPAHSSMLYRKSAVQKLLGFNSRFIRSQDCDLWLRLSEVGEIVSVNKILLKLRKHNDNISNSESGMLQTRFGYLAVICHFIRVDGYVSPSVNSDEVVWQDFVKWVDGRLQVDGVYKRRQIWMDFCRKLPGHDNSFFSSLQTFLGSGEVTRLLWGKFFGSSLPYQMAQEWGKKIQ